MASKRREWLERLDELYDPRQRVARTGFIRLGGLIEDQFYYSQQHPEIELPQLLATHFANKADMFVWYKSSTGLQIEFDRVTQPEYTSAPTAPNRIDPRDPGSVFAVAQKANEENLGRRGGGKFVNNPSEALTQVDEYLRGHPDKHIVALFHQTGWHFPRDNSAYDQNLAPSIMEWPKLCYGKHLVIFSADPIGDWLNTRFRGPVIDLKVGGPTSDEIKARLVYEYFKQNETFFSWQYLEVVARFFEKMFASASGVNVGYRAFVSQMIRNRGTTNYDKKFLDSQPSGTIDYQKIDVAGFREHLEANIIGQTRAKKWAIEAVGTLQKLGVPANRERPLPVLKKLFAGPSGVGKSEIARVMSRFVFDRDPLVIAGTEYPLEQDVAKLLGAQPGYVGYGTPSPLVKYLRDLPYGLILLDEFEKCHETIRQFFMNALDFGISLTSDGQELNFGNTIIIATTNTGSKEIDEIQEADSISPTQRDQMYRRAISTFYNQALLGRLGGELIFDRFADEERLRIVILYKNLFVQRTQKERAIPSFQIAPTDLFYSQLLVRVPKNLGARRIKEALESILNKTVESYYEQSGTNRKPIVLDWSGDYPTINDVPFEGYI